MKSLIFTLLLLCSLVSNSQYIGVRARYTDSRVVLNVDPMLPPSRESRLVLSFYHVLGDQTYVPVSLTNHIVYLQHDGLQYSNYLDSVGNNYPGYLWTAPKVVSYFGTYLPNAIDCNPFVTTAYTVNGHELDCGFIRVSYWEEDLGNSTGVSERFSAPNICLPYYMAGDPYSIAPGNVNFQYDGFPGSPYHMYTFLCAGSPQQLAIRGWLPLDTGSSVVLPIKLINERATVLSNCNRKIEWTNMTEANMQRYEVERSVDGVSFVSIANVLPRSTSGTREDYIYVDTASLNAERIYYRIKCVENASVPFYSTIIPLHGCSFVVTPKLSIYPNPSRESKFTLTAINLPAGRYQVMMLNALTQLRMITTIDHTGGTLYKLFDLHWLPFGMYTIVLQSNSLTLSSKWLRLD